jgi:hypothetical protein
MTIAVKQHAGEQAPLTSACGGVARGGVAAQLPLNRIPQRRIDDRRVFAGMGLALENDLAAIEAALQHQVERTARERLVADEAPRSACPRLAFDPSGFKLVLQQPNRAEFGVAAEGGAHEFRLAVDNDELAVLHPIPERRYPAHPMQIGVAQAAGHDPHQYFLGERRREVERFRSRTELTGPAPPRR